MNIFDKRPLSLILCITLGGFVLFSVGGDAERWAVVAAIVALLLVYTVLKLVGIRKIILAIAALALICSSAFSHLYFDLWFRADRRFEGEVDVFGTVAEIQYSQHSTAYIIDTYTIDLAPNTEYSLILRIPDSEAIDLREGSKVLFKCTLEKFDKNSDFDAESYYYSKGINATAGNAHDVTITEHGTPPVSYTAAYAREYIRRYACLLSDADSGNLLTALLLGERSMLSSQLQLDFKRIGITHILALSGMHLAILTHGLGKLLSILGFSKKPRTVISILFTLAYMVFTGLSVSVVRAGIMLIISSLVFLCAKGYDSITSVFMAVFAICVVTPYAIYDMSLWLSAFATFGIIVFSEFFSEIKPAKSRIGKCAMLLLSLFLSTVFAITATLIITAFKFSSVSIISLVSTIIFSTLTEAIIYLGSFMLILGRIIPVGKLLIPLVSITQNFAGSLSSFKWAYSYTYSPFVRTLAVLLCAVFIIFVAFNIKHKRIYVTAMTLLLVVMLSTATVISAVNTYQDKTVYSSESKCDLLLIKDNGVSTLVNSSQYSNATAYSARSMLISENLPYLDNYVFTHYSWGISDDLVIILAHTPVNKIYLPNPENDDENAILGKIRVATEDFRTEICFIDINESMQIGHGELELLYSLPYGEGTSTNAFSYTLDSKELLYLSSGMLETPEGISFLNRTENSSVIIHGEHGKRYAGNKIIKEYYPQNECIIINCQNVFFTQYSYAEYKNNGCKIYLHPSTVNILFFED